MGDLHNLVEQHGRSAARNLVEPTAAAAVDIAADLMADTSDDFYAVFAGFAMTGLPYRDIPPGEIWKRVNGKITMTITPGHTVKNGEVIPVGIPYGAKARLILVYLQSQAIITQSRTITVGSSLHAWLVNMGLSIGGETFRQVRKQIERISHAQISFFYEGEQGNGFSHDHFVSSGFSLTSDSRQGSLWEEKVTLGETFFNQLLKHPIPVWEPAIKALAAKSMAMDIYIWLAYRLHVLDKPTPVGWVALAAQFGPGTTNLKHFKPEFKKAFAMASAAYEEAKAEITEQGVTLYPSPSPVLPRIGRSGK